MTSLATPAQLATYLQTATEAEATAGSPNVLDTLVAQQALDSASAKIRAAAGWHIAPPETVTKTYGGFPATVDGYSRVLPLTDVFLPSLQVADVVLTAAGQPLPDWAAVVDLESGVIQFNPYWTVLGSVVVTYTSGFEQVPDAIRGLCLELAAGIYANPGNTISTTYGSVTETYRSSAAVAAPEDLRADPRLAPYVIMAFA